MQFAVSNSYYCGRISVASFVSRIFSGFTTASTAFVADIVPWQRRGEAMGIMGVSMNAGASMAPPIGSMIANRFWYQCCFFLSSGFALISILFYWD
ncbi:MAG: MFS transporter [Saprospiraceae bacterium]